MGYIPSTDAGLLSWADNFSTLITANPTLYGLVAGNAVTIAALVATWDSAYATAINPATRTPASVAAKDSAKGAMVPVLRLFAQQIKNNSGVTNENKTALGIHINDTGPTPVPPPSTAPALTLDSQHHLQMTIRARDQTTPTSNAKPTGVLAGIVFTKIGTAAATDPTEGLFNKIETKTPFVLDFDAADVGKVCTMWSRWTNRKGELGPWSNPLSQNIA